MKTLKEEIDSLHEHSSFRDFQMAVQRIFQGMTEGSPVDLAEAKQSMLSTITSSDTTPPGYYHPTPPVVTFAEEEK